MSDTGSKDREISPAPPQGAHPGSSATQALAASTPPAVCSDGATVISNRAPMAAPALAGANPAELGRTLVGQRLDHFDLQEFVGGGGMGAVFRALDTRLNRIVALKVLAGDQADAEDKVRRFQNEAQSAARLDHEHIARVFYVGQDCGLHYIVFEFIEGVNLRDLVDRKGPLPLDEAFSYTLQIADALAHASSRDVVHRDIKPSNVLITPQGKAKLVDMGLARLHLVEHADGDLTSSGVTLGTFDYISPEQARDPRSADVRSDIYSLGCTLYFVLTGQPPFPDGNVLQKLLQHTSEAPPNPAEFNPDLPEGVSHIVRKMLAKDPKRRYQTPVELIHDLLNEAARLGLSMHAPDSVALVTRRFTRYQFLEKHIPWVAPLVALIGAVLALDYFSSRQTGTQNETASSGRSKAAVRRQATTPHEDAQGSQLSGMVNSSSLPTGSNSEASANSTPPPLNVAAQSPVPGSATSSVAAMENSAGSLGTPDALHPLRTLLQNRQSGAALSAEFAAAGISVDQASGPPGTEGGPPRLQVSLGPTLDGSVGAIEKATPPAVEPPREPGVLVVNPHGNANLEFLTLRAACAKVKNNEIIELRYNGPYEERPIKLNNLKITLRAGQDYRPVILFRPKQLVTADPLQSMLTINGGQLSLIGVALEFEVPSHAEVPQGSWSLLQIQRPDWLHMQQCSLTIRNATHERQLLHQDVAFIDVKSPPGSSAMAMENGTVNEHTVPLHLQDCLARGEATFLRTGDLQPFQLKWDNGLLATSERLLTAVGNEVPTRGTGAMSIELRHVTAAVRSGLISMRSSESARYLLPTYFKCNDSLLIGAANGNAPLLEQSGVQTLPEFREHIQWDGSRYFFTDFNVFWSISSSRDSPQQQLLSFEQWQEYWGLPKELSATWSKVYLKSPPDPQRPMHAHTVSDYLLDDRVDDNAARGGASDLLDAGFLVGQLPSFPGTGGSEAPAR